jgi:hypothetical protein
MDIRAFFLHPASSEIAIWAQWQIEAFSDELEPSLQGEISSLEHLASGRAGQAVLLAACDGAPAGTCLLARSALEPCRSVSPWLAGLYVAPEYRRRGVVSRQLLVSAIPSKSGHAETKNPGRIHSHAVNRELVSRHRAVADGVELTAEKKRGGEGTVHARAQPNPAASHLSRQPRGIDASVVRDDAHAVDSKPAAHPVAVTVDRIDLHVPAASACVHAA